MRNVYQPYGPQAFVLTGRSHHTALSHVCRLAGL